MMGGAQLPAADSPSPFFFFTKTSLFYGEKEARDNTLFARRSTALGRLRWWGAPIKEGNRGTSPPNVLLYGGGTPNASLWRGGVPPMPPSAI